MIIKFAKLFNIFKETDNSKTPNLTEERIYSYCQDISKGMQKVPVFSGATQNRGVVGYVPNYVKKRKKSRDVLTTSNKINYYFNKEGCITIVADGKAGYMFYRDKNQFPIFCMNISCLAIFKKKDNEIKKDYSEFDGLNLKWFFLRFNNLFKNTVIGEGVQHFTQKIYENIELEIPNLKEQEIELRDYEEIYDLHLKLISFENKISNLKEKNLIIDKKFESLDNLPAEKVFETVSGNSGLTEEYIYSRINLNEKTKKYNVLSSSTISRTYMGEVPKGRLPNGRNLTVFENKEGLLVIRNGKAGKLIYLSKGNYTLNDHAYILYLNKKYIKKIKLKWIIYQYQNLFLEFSSSSDNGTWNKTNFMKYAEIKIIPPEEQSRIIFIYGKLETLEKNICSIQEKINDLLEKELIPK